MRRVLLLVSAACAACTTVVPMQTASVVEARALRLGAQLGTAGFCGNPGDGAGGVFSCGEFPEGVPLPELRASGRLGLGHRADVGLALAGQGFLFAPQKVARLGLSVDVKRELFRVQTSGPTHLVSAGLLGGGSVAGRFGLSLTTTFEWAVPLFYGLQFEHVEFVLGLSAVDRLVADPGPAGTFHTPRLDVTLGVFKRNPAGIAVQLGWLVNPLDVSSGALQLQFALFFDVH